MIGTGFHKAFESKIRLGIMSALLMQEKLDFNALKEYLALTDGNLASHLKALEKTNFIQIKKQFIGKKPNTEYSITPKGKAAFQMHLNTLESLIHHQKDTLNR